MKRMIDNKDYETLKDNVNNINEELELKDTNYIITSVVVDGEEVEGFIIKDVKNDVDYNISVGGGKQLYQHNIMFNDNNYPFNFGIQITNDSPTPMTTSTPIINYLSEHFPSTGIKYLVASGSYSTSIVVGIYYSSSVQYVRLVAKTASTHETQYIDFSRMGTITDEVIPL